MRSHAVGALTASSFSLTIDGVEAGQFFELVELKSLIDRSAFTNAPGKEGALDMKNVPVRRPPPAVTLKRGKNKDLAVFTGTPTPSTPARRLSKRRPRDP
jgi:hypothetical protein